MVSELPASFAEAVKYARERELMPTALGSAEIRELAAAVRQRSLFMARVTNAEVLQELADQIEALQQGRTNFATAMMKMRQTIAEEGYNPREGFPGDAERGVPPAEPFSLQDVHSHSRTELALRTNLGQAYGFGQRQQGNEPDALYQFPCWELVRVGTREVPRGYIQRKGKLVADPANKWTERWLRAGGTIYGDERMVARKDDPVWKNLGSSEEFPDGLDNAYPPFAFNSGMGWLEIDREESVALGIISEDEIPMPDDGVRFAGPFDVNSDRFDPLLAAELARELQLRNRDTVAGLLAMMEVTE